MAETARERAIEAVWGLVVAALPQFQLFKSMPRAALHEVEDLPALILYSGEDEPAPDDVQELGSQTNIVAIGVTGVRIPYNRPLLDDREELRGQILAPILAGYKADTSLGQKIKRLDYAGTTADEAAGELTPQRSIVMVGFALWWAEDPFDPYRTVS